MNELHPIPGTARKLGQRFDRAGFQLFVVGGAVRDQVLGLSSTEDDIDMTTDARPADIVALLEPIATAVWRQGERFGTIGATVFGRDVEITTFRSETYSGHSRKPVVGFGDDLRTDLSRRDFTINAMALSASDGDLHDPFDGAGDLRAGLLRTPLAPEVSFNDDPLRMLRAARFAARLDLRFDDPLIDAATALAPRMEIVSGERIFAEIERLLRLPDPSAGIEFLWTTGVLSAAFDRAPLPSFTTVAEAIDRMAHAEPVDSGVRWAALCVLTGVDVEELSFQLRMSVDRRKDLSRLSSDRLPTTYQQSDLRRLILKPGRSQVLRMVQLERILEMRPDPELARLAADFSELVDREPAHALRSPLSGGEILSILNIDPGPVVGDVTRHLEELAVEQGPLSPESAAQAARLFLQRKQPSPTDGPR